MTPEQALQYLMQVFVIKGGLSVQEIAAAVQAWNTVAEAITHAPARSAGEPKEQPKEA